MVEQILEVTFEEAPEPLPKPEIGDPALVAAYSAVLSDGRKLSYRARINEIDDPALVAAYIAALRDGRKLSYRARINIVGHSGAGKTSLARRLLGQHFLENLGSTDGIETHAVKFDPDVLGEWSKSTWGDDFSKFIKEKLKEEHVAHSAKDLSGTSQQGTKDQKSAEVAGRQQTEQEAKQPDFLPADHSAILENLKQKMKIGDEQYEKGGRLRLWDFGGQEEFYATHHMFLDDDANTLIVLDISKNLRLPIRNPEESFTEGLPHTQEQMLCYWLQTLLSMMRDPSQLQDSVAVVLTHTDDFSQDSREDKIKAYTDDIMDCLETRGLSHCVKRERIYAVSNKLSTDEEYNQLRQHLLKMFKNKMIQLGETRQSLWGIELPARWLLLEDRIIENTKRRVIEEEMKTMGINVASPKVSASHMTREDLETLSASCGVPDVELESFLRFYHAMGDLIYYPDRELRDITITDPQWLVDMFKVLIAPDEFIANRVKNKRLQRKLLEQLYKHGKVKESELRLFWEGQNVQFLTDLMLKYNLMLPLVAPGVFLVPCMMPFNEETDVEDIEPFPGLQKTFEFKITRPCGMFQLGSFSRLLVLCSKSRRICDDDPNLCYRYASFLVRHDSKMRLSFAQPEESRILITLWPDPEDPEDAQKDDHGTVDALKTEIKDLLRVAGICDVNNPTPAVRVKCKSKVSQQGYTYVTDPATRTATAAGSPSQGAGMGFVLKKK